MAKTVNSFAALGELWNATHGKKAQVRVKAPKEGKPRVCRLCGETMKLIAGTNVYVCPSMIETPKPTEENPDAKEQVPCGNFAISKR